MNKLQDIFSDEFISIWRKYNHIVFHEDKNKDIELYEWELSRKPAYIITKQPDGKWLLKDVRNE